MTVQLHSIKSKCISKCISTLFEAPLEKVSGAYYLTLAIEQLLPMDAAVMGVPGSPITETLTSLKKTPLRGFSEFEEVDLARYLAGITRNGKMVVCIVKHNGFLALQEILNSLTNHDLRAPLIVIVGDEIGETSQVAVDTRFLCDSHELPLIEPSFEKIPEALAYATSLSSLLRKPVVYRLAPSVAEEKRQVLTALTKNIDYRLFEPQADVMDYFASEGLALGRSRVTSRFLENEAPHMPEYEGLKTYEARGNPYLVIATGGIMDRVYERIQGMENLDFLEINTPTILSPSRLVPIIKAYKHILVLESWLPYLETKLRALVQQCGLVNVQVLGRMPNLGELPFIREGNFVLRDQNLSKYLAALSAGQTAVKDTEYLEPVKNHLFLKIPDYCAPKYLKVYETFQSRSQAICRAPCLSVSTGRTRYAVTGSSFESTVKFMPPMGAKALVLMGYLDGHPQPQTLAPGVILGDYTFMHSAWKGVVRLEHYLKRTGIKIPTVIIDNGGSMTTGGQPCEPPEKIGLAVIPNWSNRFLGTISVDETHDLVEAITTLNDSRSARNILVVRF